MGGICVCGHKKEDHHNHMDYAWGAGSLCTRCTKCDWDSFACIKFIERKGILCPECKQDTISSNTKRGLFTPFWSIWCWSCKKHFETPKKYRNNKYLIG